MPNLCALVARCGLLAATCVFLTAANIEHKCSYQVPRVDDVIIGVPLDVEPSANGSYSAGRIKRNAHHRSLRIELFYDSSITKLSLLKQEFISKSLLPAAIGFWERALFVRRSTAPIRLNRKCINSQYYVHPESRQHSCAHSCRPVTKCGEVLVPDQHLYQCRYCRTSNPNSCSVSGPPDGVGVPDADFVLYVSSVASDRCSSADTVAYAAHCQQEADLDRPIAGHVNLCPQAISTELHDQEVLSSTVKHEILHALGFSAGLYAFFRDEFGNPRTHRNVYGKPQQLNAAKGYYEWSENTVRTVRRLDWWTRKGLVEHDVQMVVTPKVTEKVREYFGCNSLEGAELENQGGDGTAMTHWEKRLFENEAMTGTHTQNPVYSKITLALMEDSGWYRANYSVAEELHWARNLGCLFAKKSCGEWIKLRKERNLSVEPFCDQVKRSKNNPYPTASTTCTNTKDSLALCNLVQYKDNLMNDYQNFLSLPGIPQDEIGTYGGSVELADFCPYNQEFEWKNESSRASRRDSRCEFEANTPVALDNAALETYGVHSKCFKHANNWVQRRCGYKRTFRHYGAGCYQFHCVDGRLWLDLLNGSAVYPCYRTGYEIVVRQVVSGWLHEGIVICPSCQEMCQSETSNFICLPDSSPPHQIGDPPMSEPCAGLRPKNCWLLLFVALLLLRLSDRC